MDRAAQSGVALALVPTLAVVLALSGSGCAATLTPMNSAQLPAAWQNLDPSANHSAERSASANWPDAKWYRSFGSEELDGLVAAALSANPDVAVAGERLTQAEAQSRAAGAALVPKVGVNAGITNYHARSGSQSASETDWVGLLSASYELDLWGHNGALRSAARARAAAVQADQAAVALVVAANTAAAYFELCSVRERQKLAQQNLDATRQTLSVTEARFHSGIGSEVEVASQRALVAQAELTVPEFHQQERATRGALALLVGRNPEGFEVQGAAIDDLKEPEVAPGLPAELLVRRPDILTAEANLRAANADLAATRAAFFPNITLTTNGGIQNPALQAAVLTLTGTGTQLALGAGIVQSIFDGGQRRAVRAEAEARYRELLITYRAAIRTALLDVENALSLVQQLDQQQAAESENLTQSERAFDGAQRRYQAGNGDHLLVLESQRTLLAARERVNQYRLKRLTARVSLCKALGGGWNAAIGHGTLSQ